MEQENDTGIRRIGLSIPEGEVKLVQELVDEQLYGSLADFYAKAGHRLLEIHGKLKTEQP